MTEPIKSPSTVSSHSHSSSSKDSFCLSSNYCTSLSDSQTHEPTDSLPKPGREPTRSDLKLSDSKPLPAPNVGFSQLPVFKPPQLANPSNTIYSLDWTNSAVTSIESFEPDNPLFDLTTMDPDLNAPQRKTVNHRCVPPTLPAPMLWSTFTHNEEFAEYIAAQGLCSQYPAPFQTTEQVPAPKGELELNKDYANMQLITDSNCAPHRIHHQCSWHWVTDFLLRDANLPVPFNSDLVSSHEDI